MSTSSPNSIKQQRKLNGKLCRRTKRSLQQVKELVQQRADVNSTTKAKRSSALHNYAEWGKDDVVRFLLQQSADVNLCNTQGQNALCLACESGSIPTVQELILGDPNWGAKASSALIAAVEACQLDVVKHLTTVLEVDVNSCDDSRRSAVLVAAGTGNASLAEFLLQHHADPNRTSYDGESALMCACEQGDLEAVTLLTHYRADVTLSTYSTAESALHKLVRLHGSDVADAAAITRHLVAKNADVNAVDNMGRTPLMASATRRQLVDVHTALLERNADAAIVDDKGNTALILAASRGNLKLVELLLDTDDSVLNHMNTDKDTAVLRAARAGHGDVVKALVGRQADIHIRNRDNLTPLLLAVTKNRLPVVQCLIEAKADVMDTTEGLSCFPLACRSPKSAELVTALHQAYTDRGLFVDVQGALFEACQHSDSTTVHVLLQLNGAIEEPNGDGLTPLCVACDQDNSEVVRVLLEQQADPCAVTPTGLSPVHFAADSQTSGALQLLLECPGVSVNAVDSEGNTPLIIATRNDSADINFLLSNSADVQLHNHQEETALHFAAKKGNLSVTRRLVDMRASLNNSDIFGNTPLMKALEAENYRVADELLKLGAAVNHTNAQRLSPLHIAAANATDTVAPVSSLVDSKSMLNTVDCQGETPIMKAATKGNINICAFLLQLKADVRHKNHQGSTVLSIAQSHRHHGLQRLLRKAGAPERDNWSCTRCTFLNPLDDLVCSACESPKDTDLLSSPDISVSKSVTRRRLSKRSLDRTVIDLCSPAPKRRSMLSDVTLAMKEIQISYQDLEVGEVVGDGGFGCVHRGVFRGADVAIKKLHGRVRDPKVLDKFVQEAFMIVGLRHPHLVQCMGITMDPPSIVMEFVPHTLAAHIKQNGPLPLQLCLKYSSHIAAALCHLHCRQPAIVHRDVKPGNVLIDGTRAKLADFGISREVLQNGEDETMTRIGTFQYMPPELWDTEKIRGSPAVDVYAFGMLMYEMLAGKKPFPGFGVCQLARALLEKRRPIFPASPDALTSRVHALVRKCWAEQPRERPSMEQVVLDLKRLQDELRLQQPRLQRAESGCSETALLPTATVVEEMDEF